MRRFDLSNLDLHADSMPPPAPWTGDDTRGLDGPRPPETAVVPTPAVMENEIAFISGVTAAGRVAATSFWTWNRNSPATYQPVISGASKWGSGTLGSGSGALTYYFTPASNWTATEKDALASGLALWSALANVTFTETSTATGAKLTFTRGADGSAYENDNATSSIVNGSTVGVKSTGMISIDTSVAGFGPIGAGFTNYGGYPWETLVHEEGHFLGLGHGGAYNGSVNPATQQFSAADNRLYSLMSYIDPFTTTAANYEPGTFWGTSVGSNGSYYANRPTTPMMLDILAIQRLYGAPTSTPLSGNNVFGFHSNITGLIAKFFDFSINTAPVVTLWSSGLNNTLDLSGFTTASKIDLHAGAFSSAGYDARLGRAVTNNITIGLGVRIDTGIGGPGADTLIANDFGNHLVGGAGADTLTGGAGADMLEGGTGADVIQGGYGADILYGNDDADILYGNQDNDVLYGNQGADTLYGGQGADSLYGGQGDDSMFGNADNDVLEGGAGVNRVDGGDGIDTAAYAFAASGVSVSLALQGQLQATGISTDLLIGIENLTGSNFADTLTGDASANFLQGGLGADTLSGGAGNDVLFGEADNDVLYGNQDSDALYGGVGNDTLYGGQGDDFIIGGAGADVLFGNLGIDTFQYFATSDSPVGGSDLIADFTSGVDKIELRPIHTGGAADVFSLTQINGVTYLNVDLGNDGSIEMQIVITGTVLPSDVIWS